MDQSIHFARMAELEEGTGTEASDSQLLETVYSSDLEDSVRWAVAFSFFVCFAAFPHVCSAS
jgi:hypothetical protein